MIWWRPSRHTRRAEDQRPRRGPTLAVRGQPAANEAEALELGVIDAIATDVDDLLRQLNGWQAEATGRTITSP
ncbi:MAG: hypothetical protein Q9O62_07925 [Ardenticatenia bacterium]|nr:hypothetical protein [Ardenticatenia bacterium]